MRRLVFPHALFLILTTVLLVVTVPRVLLAQGRAAPRAAAPAHGGPPGHVGPPVHGGPPVHVNVGFGYGYYPWWGFGFHYGWYPYYRPWYAGWYGYGWWPPYAYGYPPYPYYGPYGGDGYAVDMTSASVRLEVKPRDAEVYVDGYLAGKIDDFDGTFQRLHVRPGDHELVLYRDGYRTVKQHVTLAPNSDQKIQFAMEPLAPGETAEARPVPPPASEQSPTPQEPPPPPGYGRGAPPPPQTPPQEPTSSTFGSLSLNIQPADAEIIVDGAPWTIPPGEAHLILRLPEGKHHVEVRKPGLATYTEDVGIQRGRTLTLNVSLHDPGGAR